MRPVDQIKEKRSFVVHWKGTDPYVKPSHWAPGYTPGYRETEEEAIAQAGVELLEDIARVRERWLKLSLLAEKVGTEMPTGAFGPVVTVTETDMTSASEDEIAAGLEGETVILSGDDIEDMVIGISTEVIITADEEESDDEYYGPDYDGIRQ